MPPLNILVLYNAEAMAHSPVAEQLKGLQHHSAHQLCFLQTAPDSTPEVDLTPFDAVFIHQSVPITQPNQVSRSLLVQLVAFEGPVVLATEDPFDQPHAMAELIAGLGVRVILSPLPEDTLASRYDTQRLAPVDFVSIPLNTYSQPAETQAKPYIKRVFDLTYVWHGAETPDDALAQTIDTALDTLTAFGHEKKHVVDLRRAAGKRPEGLEWQQYIGNSRAFLGLDASLDNSLPWTVLDAIAHHTALVLPEGADSGTPLIANQHYIPLKANLSNLDEVFGALKDFDALAQMAQTTYDTFMANGCFNLNHYIQALDTLFADLVQTPKGFEPINAVVGYYHPDGYRATITPVGESLHLRQTGLEPLLATTAPVVQKAPLLAATLVDSRQAVPQAPQKTTLAAKPKRGAFEKVGRELDRFSKRYVLMQPKA